MKKLFQVLFTLLVTAMMPIAVFAAEPISMDTLGTYIQSEFKKTHIPGMSVQIVDGNNVLFSEAYGDCDSANTPFIIGSMSKSFTAVAIMQLVEQGRIDISKPFTDYLPTSGNNCKTTVKQLLNHTSGISVYSTMENYKTSDRAVPYEYANVNYGLLGKIIEHISGVDYGTYIQKNVFDPLGMRNSYTSLEAAKANGLADGHRNYFGFMVKGEMDYPKEEITGWLTLPAGYIISTVADMGKYLQAYLNDGNGILTSQSMKTLLYEDTVAVQEGYQYSMGWGLDTRMGDLMLTHGGNVENYTTNMQILPEQGLGVVVLFNACDFLVANEMALKFAYNISYKLLGAQTTDIAPSAYLQSHIFIDAILLLVLLLSLLPLLRLKKWCIKNKGKLRIKRIFFVLVVHLVLPTLILTALAMLGEPMFVVKDFAPDVFIIQMVSSGILYIVGVFKTAYIVKAQHAATQGGNAKREKND